MTDANIVVFMQANNLSGSNLKDAYIMTRYIWIQMVIHFRNTTTPGRHYFKIFT